MKYLSVVLALCLCVSIAARAESNPTIDVKATVVSVETKKVDVTLINLQKQTTYISIQSVDGSEIYFQEAIKKHNGYRKRLDLSELKAGKYLLVVENDQTKLQQVIVLKEDNALLLSQIK